MNKLEIINKIIADIEKLNYYEKNLIPPKGKGVYNVFDLQCNYSFHFPEPLNELQLTVSFYNTYCDILIFPHPVIIEKENIISAVRFINHVNSYVKSNGRFYIDEKYLDVAYSSRIFYDYIEAFPEAYINFIINAMTYFKDISIFLFGVCQGEMTIEEACEGLNNIWE